MLSSGNVGGIIGVEIMRRKRSEMQCVSKRDVHAMWTSGAGEKDNVVKVPKKRTF